MLICACISSPPSSALPKRDEEEEYQHYYRQEPDPDMRGIGPDSGTIHGVLSREVPATGRVVVISARYDHGLL